MECYSSFLTVDLNAVAHNLRKVKEKAGVKLMFVVKADAYGHGSVALSKALEEECDFLAVALVGEGLQLRRAGIKKPILCLGHATQDAWPLAISEDIRLTVSTLEMAQGLSQVAQQLGKTACLHLAVDTGMSRLGFQVTEEAARDCARITQLPGVRIEGCFSHFARSDEADPGPALAQKALFDTFLSLLAKEGVQIPLRHLNNSAGSIRFSEHYDMVRSGIVSYGVYPSPHSDRQAVPLKPVLQWATTVTHVKTLPAGRAISYSGTYTTTAPTRVATLSIGYADGYSRALSGKFYVLINGRKAPILGRICMDQMMVDVTDIPDVVPGTHAVLLGTDGQLEITVDEMAAAAGLISYEVLCAITPRVERRYLPLQP